MKRICTNKILVTVLIFCCHSGLRAQQTKLDSLFMNADTTAVMDSLMKDFDAYLDSMARPKSFFNVNLSIGTGIFSFLDKNSVFISNQKKPIFSPSLGYFHKSGFGLMTSAFIIYDDKTINAYQFSITPTFDMIRRKFSAGISYSRYFHKDSLNFYTTPIQNEIYSYFSYKGWWLRPSVGVSYGWGTKTEYEKQEYFIWSRLLQQSRSYYVTVTNRESIRDLALTLSLRKDFDWLDVLGKGDLMGFTPVLLLNCGTQNFGFNTTYSAAQQGTVRVNALPSNSSISETTDFAFQSVSAVLRGTYMKGKFLLQPQVFFDYALWETDQRFNTVYAVMVSMSF